jgi:hypothetical protein
MATTYDCGNSEITTEIVGAKAWSKEGFTREYFDLQSTGKSTKCIQKFTVLSKVQPTTQA